MTYPPRYSGQDPQNWPKGGRYGEAVCERCGSYSGLELRDGVFRCANDRHHIPDGHDYAAFMWLAGELDHLPTP